MSFAIRVAPGLRIAASRRALRTAFGPQPSAVHLGSGRSGSGPFSYWAGVIAQQHHPEGGIGPGPLDLAALGAQIRGARRSREIAAAARTERAIVTAHLDAYPIIAAPVVAPPDAVDRKAVTTELRSQALLRVGRWRAGREAAGVSAEEVAHRRAHAEGEYQATVQEAAGRYEALVANEPEDVLGALEAVFERRESPAAAIDCDGDAVSVVLRMPPVSAVPDAKPVVPRKGKATLRPRTAAERNVLYLRVLASGVIVLVRQTLATAPGLGQVRVLVVRSTGAAPDGRPLEAVYAGTFDAHSVAHTVWAEVDPVAMIAAIPGRLLYLVGDDGEVGVVDVAAEPDVAAVLDLLGAALHPGPAA